MHPVIKRFIDTYISTLEENPYEFLNIAYNDLTIAAQRQLIKTLQEADIDIERHRENLLRFIITMKVEELTRSVTLARFIDDELEHILGYNFLELQEFILEGAGADFDCTIDYDDALNSYVIHPGV